MNVNQILVTPLKRIPNIHGDILHVMKNIDAGYLNFGEVYFSIIKKGAIKAWKRHLRMTLNLVVPVGNVQFVFMDDKRNFRVETVGEGNYVRLTVPPCIWFGFIGLESPQSLLMNCADIPHEPDEIERKELEAIAFEWSQF